VNKKQVAINPLDNVSSDIGAIKLLLVVISEHVGIGAAIADKFLEGTGEPGGFSGLSHLTRERETASETIVHDESTEKLLSLVQEITKDKPRKFMGERVYMTMFEEEKIIEVVSYLRGLGYNI